jgi:hypothetical protein
MDNEQSPQASPKKRWYKSKWLWIFLLLIIGGVAYFGVDQVGKILKFNNLFSTSDALPVDDYQAAPDSSAWFVQDLVLTDTLSIDVDSLETPEEEMEVEVIQVEKVETKPVQKEVKMEDFAAELDPFSDAGLFEELLLPDALTKSSASEFKKYYRKDIVSSRAVLKLMAISGKRLLIGQDTQDDENILEALIDSEHVVAILIVDRKGKVAYSTNRKQTNASLKQLMPKVDLNSETMNWYQEGNFQISSVPMYHTYGKIGTAVLVTK